MATIPPSEDDSELWNDGARFLAAPRRDPLMQGDDALIRQAAEALVRGGKVRLIQPEPEAVPPAPLPIAPPEPEAPPRTADPFTPAGLQQAHYAANRRRKRR